MIHLTGYTETDHYVFRYFPGSPAERDISKISSTQEESWQEICHEMGVTPDFKIHYYLLNTPEEVGIAYGDNEPCNGFTRPPDRIYAVYNDQVQCIGPHEDAHIISYTINRPSQSFIREGLAMYFDKVWWKRPNEVWVTEFIKDGRYISVEKLLNNEEFYNYSDAITYPIAGAFTHFLISKIGMVHYLQLYRKGDFSCIVLRGVLNCDMLDEPFQCWLQEL